MTSKKKKEPYVCTWQRALRDTNLASTTKLVGMILSTHMEADGSSCFPSTRLIGTEASLSERCVCTHLETLVRNGWIDKQVRHSKGKGWKSHQYIPILPKKALNEVQHVSPEGTERGSAAKQYDTERHSTPNTSFDTESHAYGTESSALGTELHAEGTEPDDTMVLNVVQSSTSVSTSVSTSFNTSESVITNSHSKTEYGKKEIRNIKKILTSYDGKSGYWFKHLSKKANIDYFTEVIINYLEHGYTIQDIDHVIENISKEWCLIDPKKCQALMAEALENTYAFNIYLKQPIRIYHNQNKQNQRKNYESY